MGNLYKKAPPQLRRRALFTKIFQNLFELNAIEDKGCYQVHWVSNSLLR